MLLFCGLRVSELVGADVNQLGHDRGHRVLRFTVKGDAQHIVAPAAPVLKRLDAYLASRGDLADGQLPVALGGRCSPPRASAGSTAAPSGDYCAGSSATPASR